jgi:hypothetical protein
MSGQLGFRLFDGKSQIGDTNRHDNELEGRNAECGTEEIKTDVTHQSTELGFRNFAE